MSSAELQYRLDFTEKLPPEAQERIADGMATADEHADPRWKHYYDGCVLAAARKKPEITSDDALDEMEALPKPPGTHNLAAIGPAMMRARDMGILINTGRTERSRRPKKNGNLHIVWHSQVYGAPENAMGAMPSSQIALYTASRRR